jgi:hypothetical protein
MDKHYCSTCGVEVDAREVAGFTEKTTCLKCACESTNMNSEEESVKVAYIYGAAFAILFTLLFYLARYVYIY